MAEDLWATSVTEELTLDTPLSALANLPPYKRSEDKRGHDTFLGARFPKDFARWATYLQETLPGHYTIRADVIRDALSLGLQVINLRTNLTLTEWQVVEKLALLESRASATAEEYRRVQRIVKDLEVLVDNKRMQLAKDTVRDYLDTLEGLTTEHRDSLKNHLVETLRNHGLAQLCDLGVK